MSGHKGITVKANTWIEAGQHRSAWGSTMVSASADNTARSVEELRFAHRAARRQIQIHPVVRTEMRAGDLGEVPRAPAGPPPCASVAQSIACLRCRLVQ